MGHPAILTVDDDPSVSRAIARDLRRRYGEHYRIIRASSAAEALEALREIKLRGGRVAVMLADYRMPQMNGIEFLEQAMDLFPNARRALLTAYADTDAAIQAINVVDVDHYLLKPWDPPEEKLYPVIDALLDAWQATGDRELEDIRVVGHRWSEPSYQTARLPGPQPGAVPVARRRRRRRAAGCSRPPASGPESIPLVVTADGRAMAQPSTSEVGRGGRPVHRAGPRLLRPDHRRRRPGRARRGRLRRLRGPARPCWSSGRRSAGRPARARGSRTTWASRTASPARELTDRARRQAGQLRRRGAQHPRGDRAADATARPGR